MKGLGHVTWNLTKFPPPLPATDRVVPRSGESFLGFPWDYDFGFGLDESEGGVHLPDQIPVREARSQWDCVIMVACPVPQPWPSYPCKRPALTEHLLLQLLGRWVLLPELAKTNYPSAEMETHH